MNRRIVVGFAAVMMLAGCVSSGSLDTVNEKKAASINVELGVGYMKQGRLDRALVKLKRALRQNPDLPSAHTAIARLYARRGDIDQARLHFRRALAVAPDDPKVNNTFGVFLCRHGEAVHSEQYFLKAAGDPDYITPETAYTNAGICQLKVDAKDKAQADFQRALRVNAHYKVALWQLARLHFKDNEYLRARAFLQRYMAVDRAPDASVLWLAARTERALGARRQARKYVRRLADRFPDSPEAAKARKMSRDGS